HAHRDGGVELPRPAPAAPSDPRAQGRRGHRVAAWPLRCVRSTRTGTAGALGRAKRTEAVRQVLNLCYTNLATIGAQPSPTTLPVASKQLRSAPRAGRDARLGQLLVFLALGSPVR